jgi:hypothetical protein
MYFGQLRNSRVVGCLIYIFLNRTRTISPHASPLLNKLLALFLSIGPYLRTARDPDVILLLHMISLKAEAMVAFPVIPRKVCLFLARKKVCSFEPDNVQFTVCT